jgi:hypothetical protein
MVRYGKSRTDYLLEEILQSGIRMMAKFPKGKDERLGNQEEKIMLRLQKTCHRYEKIYMKKCGCSSYGRTPIFSNLLYICTYMKAVMQIKTFPKWILMLIDKPRVLGGNIIIYSG